MDTEPTETETTEAEEPQDLAVAANDAEGVAGGIMYRQDDDLSADHSCKG